LVQADHLLLHQALEDGLEWMRSKWLSASENRSPAEHSDIKHSHAAALHTPSATDLQGRGVEVFLAAEVVVERALLTPAASAICSVRAPARPFSLNSRMAASRMRARVWSARSVWVRVGAGQSF
jgi:hypothetical protein